MKKNVCVVPGCTSTDSSNESVSFHQIPKDAEVRKKWLKAINRTEPEINKKSRVCSKHFKNHDYAVTKLNYAMGKSAPSGSEIKALKNEAVPNQHLPQKSTFKIKISKKDSVKQIKVEEVKVKEEKPDKIERSDKLTKMKMPKRSAAEMSPPRSRTQSRRAASKEALKQMQLLLDDENDAVEIPDDDYFLDVIPIDPSPPPPPPPKKKYKLSHRKSSDGNDRDVIVLKTITNRDAENTLELDCWVEQLEEVQQQRFQKYKDEEKQLQAKLEELVSASSAKVIHKGDLNSIIEISEQVQSAIQGSEAPPASLILNNNLGAQQSYQLVVDPRMNIVVGTIDTQGAASRPQPKVYQGKVQVAQNLQQSPATPAATPPSRLNARRSRTGAKITPSTVTVAPPAKVSINQRSQGTPQTRGQATTVQTRTAAVPQTRAAVPQTRAAVPQTRAAVPQTRATAQTRPTSQTRPQPAPQTRAQAQTPQTRGQAVVQTRSLLQKKPAATPATPAPAPTGANTRARAPAANTFTSTVRPDETNVQGGLATGGKKIVVDLTTDDNKSAPDSREIAFNKLQGKTYPSLVVVARPHLRVQDLAVDRPKLDAKVKSVLMHAPTKFTEWLIQQGLVRSEQKCTVHTNTQLKLGMYSDVSKFPYSGGYVWISECCPQRFVSVFSGSLFEGSPHPPMVILKLLYHWSCQTNIQNVTQWVKVDNLYVKGMFTWLRSICTVALHTHIGQIGGPGVKVEVGVISLGTTSQDGNQRQVKVEVLGVLESESKLIRLRAVEPQAEGDRNYKKRFSKILEPVCRWVHPQSILVADLTVDKQTLVSMGFQNVVQYSSNQYGNNNQIMEYLRRIVPRMFQNTLSLLSRQIIQQFLDELVWREWFGTSALQAFDNLVTHLAEQTRFESGMSLIVRLNKVAQNPFKSWAINTTNTKTVETPAATQNTATNKKQRNARKPEPPKVTQPVAQDARPPKSTSPDVPEHMVPLESYYYGTIDTYSKTPKITLNMKCPFCKSMFDNNIQLMSHLFKHAHNVSMDAQLCRYCLTSVATANDLLKHIAASHPAETKFDNGFCCLICETQYMNPFVLGKHMSKEHYPSELPYQCGTCSYRCSNHKQAIDHFYKTHDNGPTIQCPFCLKSTTVFTASRNIVQNMNYFIQHLQKHQRKQFARRCGKCNLWFVQKDVLKDHQTKMHVSQRGKSGLVPWTAPRNGVMVPKSKMDKYPVDAEVINFATLKFDLSKGLMCKECNTSMDTPKHFPSFESCQNPNCQYSTCCTNAMQEHNAKCSKTSNPVADDKLPVEMYCICGFSSLDGNQMARHLAICERKSAYPSKTDAKGATVTHSMLDVLGLVRKSEEKPKTKSKKFKRDIEKSANSPKLQIDDVEVVTIEEVSKDKKIKEKGQNKRTHETAKDKTKENHEEKMEVDLTESTEDSLTGKEITENDKMVVEEKGETVIEKMDELSEETKEETDKVSDEIDKDVNEEKNEKDVIEVNDDKDVIEETDDKIIEEKDDKDVIEEKDDNDVVKAKDDNNVIDEKDDNDVIEEKDDNDVIEEKGDKDVIEEKDDNDVIKAKDDSNVIEEKDDKDVVEEKGHKDVTEAKDYEDVIEGKDDKDIEEIDDKDVFEEKDEQKETSDALSDNNYEKPEDEASKPEDLKDSTDDVHRSEDLNEVRDDSSESEDLETSQDDVSQSNLKETMEESDDFKEREDLKETTEKAEDLKESVDDTDDLKETVDDTDDLKETVDDTDDIKETEDDTDDLKETGDEKEDLEETREENRSEYLNESRKQTPTDLEDDREESSPDESVADTQEEEASSVQKQQESEEIEDAEQDVQTLVKEPEEEPEEAEDTEKDYTPQIIEESERESEEREKESEELESVEKEREPPQIEEPEDTEEEAPQIEEPEETEDSEKELEDSEKELEDSEKELEESEKREIEAEPLEKDPEDFVKTPEDYLKESEPALDKLESEFRTQFGETENTMETSEIPQEKQSVIPSDDILNILSDAVGGDSMDKAMETDIDGKNVDDVNMTSPSEMMDIPDGGETPMETD